MRAAIERYSKALSLNGRLFQAPCRADLDPHRSRPAGRGEPRCRTLRAPHPKQSRARTTCALYASKRGDQAATRDLLAELTRALDPPRSRSSAIGLRVLADHA